MTARLWNMGRDLQSRVKDFFDGPLDPAAAPLELLQATLDLLEHKVQPSGRGARVFPYNQIAVRIAQKGADRDALAAVFRQLEPRLRERLAELRCDAPVAFVTTLTVVTEPSEADALLVVDCHHDEDAAQPAMATTPRTLHIAIVKGQCEQPEYTFADAVVAIGRTPDLVDAHGNMRRNHVAFADTRDGITETVARAHARIEREATTGEYLLFNDSGSNPTTIVRAGRGIRVPPRDPRGLRLQSGDEVQLGRAVIRLRIE